MNWVVRINRNCKSWSDIVQQCQAEIEYLCVLPYWEKRADDGQSNFSTTLSFQEWVCMATHNK